MPGPGAARRILHVINMGSVCGGAERLVADLATAQRGQGRDVLVLASDRPGHGAVFADVTWAQADPVGMRARLVGQLRNPPARATLDGLVSGWRPDVVHLHTIGLLAPDTLDVLTDAPTLLTVHGPELYVRDTERWCMPPHYFRSGDGYPGRLTPRGRLAVLGASRLVGPAWRRALRAVQLYTAPSAYLAGMVARDLGPVRLVPNGFDPSPAARDRSTLDSGPRLLFTGRLEEFKGPQVLLAALPALRSRFPGLALDICGAGPLEPRLDELVRRLGLADVVRRNGWLDAGELTAYRARADLVVVPSLWPEAFGLVCLEAFAAGTPVVASAVGALPEMVRPGITGALVPPGDPDALASTVAALLEDEALRHRMGRQGRALASRYTLDAYVGAMDDAYAEAMARHAVTRTGVPVPASAPPVPQDPVPASPGRTADPPPERRRGPVGLVRAALRDSLVRNSVLLMLATVELAVGGFAFWRLITHLFDPVDVGRAAAMISAATLTANLAQLGMNNAIIRCLDRWPDRARTVNGAVTLVGATAAVGAMGVVGFATRIPVLAPGASGPRAPEAALAFVALTTLGAVSLIYDNVFVALRRSGYVLVRNGVMVALRLALPTALVGLGAAGVFDAYWLAVGLSLPLYLAALHRRFGLSTRPTVATDRIRAMWRYAAGNYLATAIIMLPNLAMPVLVAQRTDPAQAAYYYIAALVAGVLTFVPQAATRSFFAEAAREPGRQHEYLRRLLTLTAALQVPVILTLLVAGRPLLGVFAPVYARAYPVLVLLTLTGAASSISFIGSTLLLVSGRLRLLCQLSAVAGTIALLGAYVLGRHGVVWVGWSLLAGESVLALGYTRVIAEALRGRRPDGTGAE